MRHASHFSYRRRRSTSGHIMRAAASRLQKILIIPFSFSSFFFIYVCLKLTSLVFFVFPLSYHCALSVRVCHLSWMNEWMDKRERVLTICRRVFPVFVVADDVVDDDEKKKKKEEEKNECICPSIRNALVGTEKDRNI